MDHLPRLVQRLVRSHHYLEGPHQWHGTRNAAFASNGFGLNLQFIFAFCGVLWDIARNLCKPPGVCLCLRAPHLVALRIHQAHVHRGLGHRFLACTITHEYPECRRHARRQVLRPKQDRFLHCRLLVRHVPRLQPDAQRQ